MSTTTTRRVPAGQAVLVAAIALLVAAAVNGRDLRRTAEGQPYGPVRDAAMVLTAPVDLLADRLGLGAPRRALEAATGREPAPAGARFGSGVQLDPAGSGASPGPADRPGPPPGQGGQTGQGGSAVADGGAPTTAPAPPGPTRVATAEEPVRVLFVGDSLVANVATGFGRTYQDDPRLVVDVDFHVATGLARPDVLDWPTYLAGRLEGSGVDVVVVLVGANDDQDLRTEDGPAELLTDEWQAEYARRIGVMMDLAAAEGRQVVWLGMPAMGRPDLEAARLIMHHLATTQASGRDRVAVVDLAASLSPEGYAPFVGGTRARAPDGVHMTVGGASLAAHDVLAAFAPAYGLG